MNNIIGQKFGRLKVESIEESKYYTTKKGYKKERKRVKVLCNCGTVKIVDINNLKNGNTKSCGCLKEEILPEARKKGHKNREVDHSPIKRQFRNYKYTASKKGYIFNINFDTFLELVKQNCSYCGITPNLKVTNETKSKSEQINGIDRLDPELGYVEGNIVSCCSDCNYAKRRMSVDRFLEFINRVYNHQQKIKENNKLK